MRKALLPLISISLLLTTLPAVAQKKPAANTPVVLGTKQLPGQFGKIGTTYTIGKESPLNFTLVSAEYRADRFIGENFSQETQNFVPPKGRKLLVLKYTVQNPNKVDTRLWYMSFDIIAVSADDENSKLLNRPWVGSNTKYQDVMLKPAQKVTVTSAIFVPGEGETPKLIVQREREPNAAVIRYDLRGKVAKLSALYSEDGITALDTVKGAPDTYYPWNSADFKFISLEPLAEKVPNLDTPADSTQYAVKLGFKGLAPAVGRLWYGQFRVLLKTTDGDLIEQKNYTRLKRMSNNEDFNGTVPVGEEMTLRFIVDVPKNAKVAQIKISLAEDPGFRAFTFDVAK